MPERVKKYTDRDGVRRFSVTDDEKPGAIGIYTEVQMDRILKSIEEAREVEASRSRPTNRHLARVPMTVYEQSIHERWDDARWRKWLNDPDNAHLRVWGGQV